MQILLLMQTGVEREGERKRERERKIETEISSTSNMCS